MNEFSPRPAADPAPADRAALIFGHIQAAYGGSPEFAAAAPHLRAFVGWLVANPKSVSWVLPVLALVFPQAAPVLNGLGPVLALILQQVSSAAAAAPVNATGPGVTVTAHPNAATLPAAQAPDPLP